MIPAGIMTGLFPRNQMQTVAEPFVWGSGGRRMTPQDIARERDIAASLMEPDYSPVSSPWQGLARVAGNVTGALRDREADRASQANADYSAQIAASLSGGDRASSASPGVGQSTAPGGNIPMLMQVIADPYADRGVKALAQMQLEQAQAIQMKELEWKNREQPEIVQLANIANDPTQPEWRRQAAQAAVDAKNDPFVNIIGNEQFGSYSGRQSGLSAILGAQGSASSPAPGTVVADPRKLGSSPPPISSAPPPPDAAAMARARAEADAWLKLNGMSR